MTRTKMLTKKNRKITSALTFFNRLKKKTKLKFLWREGTIGKHRIKIYFEFEINWLNRILDFFVDQVNKGRCILSKAALKSV